MLVYMRVTVNIDEDVLVGARALAERKKVSLGAALSELARRGFKASSTETYGDGTVFKVPADAKPITSEDVYQSLSDLP